MWHTPVSCWTQQRAVGTSQENRHRPLIDRVARLNKHRLVWNEGKTRKGGEERWEPEVKCALQNPKKGRLLVSDLIKTHRIMVIIAIFKSEQWDESDGDRSRSVTRKFPSMSTCCPRLSPDIPQNEFMLILQIGAISWWPIFLHSSHSALGSRWQV